MFLFLPISLLPGVKEILGVVPWLWTDTYVKQSTSLIDWLEVIWIVENWNVADLEPIILSYP